jgi:magnesium chelatase accessory protein
MAAGTSSVTRPRRRRWLALLALLGAAFGVRAVLRRRRPPALPPAAWGRSHHYLWRGDEVCFQQLGSGPVVVLVHALGPGHDSGEWQRVAELLADRCTLMAPDLPGWGRSAAGREEPRPRLYAEFLADFLAEVVARPAVLVAAGASAGFALAAAGAAGGRARALGLVSPRGLGEPAPSAAAELLAGSARVPGLGGLALRPLTSRAAIQRHLERAVFAAPERADAARREAHFRAARRPEARRALLAYLAGRLAVDVEPLLSRVTVPLWLAWGRQAVAPAVEAADLWLQRAPSAELDVLEGSGALPHLEVPVAFARKLSAFVDRLSP